MARGPYSPAPKDSRKSGWIYPLDAPVCQLPFPLLARGGARSYLSTPPGRARLSLCKPSAGRRGGGQLGRAPRKPHCGRRRGGLKARGCRACLIHGARSKDGARARLVFPFSKGGALGPRPIYGFIIFLRVFCTHDISASRRERERGR